LIEWFKKHANRLSEKFQKQMGFFSICVINLRRILPGFFDISIVIFINALLVYFELYSPYVTTGFYCEDPNLKLPFKKSIISDRTILLSLTTPIFVVSFLLEKWRRLVFSLIQNKFF
jgi:hypothetical protein